MVLLDVRMPGGGGLRAAREISRRCAPTKVVALSAHEDSDTVIGMISAGASAYVPKGDSTDKILRTIHRTIDANYAAADQPPQLALISPILPRRTQQSTAVAKAILDGAITVEFEPIEDLATGRVVGFEARPRVATLPHRSYDTWLADAEAADLLLDLEMAAFRVSLQALPVIPEDLFLEFEVTPPTADRGTVPPGDPPADRRSCRVGTLAARPGRRVSARGRRSERDPCDAPWTRDPYRREGSRTRVRRPSAPLLAFPGTGSAGRNAGPDPWGEASRATPSSLRWPRARPDMGAGLIAPGVVSEAQLHELRNLGVELVQGPIVGDPVPTLGAQERSPGCGGTAGVKLWSPGGR